jgi:hypothetical protein
VSNEEVLHKIKEDKNILHTVIRRKFNWICLIRCRNCLPKHVIEDKIEGMIEVAVKTRAKSEQLLDDLKETGGYWKLKGEALYRTVWRTRFGSGYGPVARQTME